MLGRLSYYLHLAWLDFTRLRHTTQHHVVIIAGIVLPILLLLGLKRGHVAELRKELLESPTGRQITIWSGQHGALIDNQCVEDLSRNVAGIDLVIPELQRVVTMVRNADGNAEVKELDVTLFATRPGDPILRQAGCEIPSGNDSLVVISDLVATQLGVQVGDNVDVIVSRTTSRGEETVRAKLQIASILQQDTEKSQIGFSTFPFLDRCDQWVRGFWVESLGWPASGDPIPARYCAYLAFTEGPATLTDEDLRTLKDRGFLAELTADALERTLAGAISPDKAETLTVWRVTPEGSTPDSPVWVTNPPAEFEAITHADDVVVAWTPPRQGGDLERLLVGVTLKKRSWLRAFLRSRSLAFEPLEASSSYEASPPLTDRAMLTLRTTRGVQLQLAPRSSESDEAENSVVEDPGLLDASGMKPMYIVSAQYLARLGAFERGEAEYDPSTGVFVEKPTPSAYGKARLFTHNIDEVPEVVEDLTKRNFSVKSESGRISEIHEQDSSLQLLVWVVATGVFLFGIVTVFSVLLDSTDRKRGVLGILRVMGVSRRGVFILVLVRAAALGILAGLLAAIAGFAIEKFLSWVPTAGTFLATWKPVVSIQVGVADIAIVILGAILCAAIGAILPAFRASRIDPFDAIVEGRFT